MRVNDIPFTLKDGRPAVLGFVTDSDARDMLNLIFTTAYETPFTGRSPEDCCTLTEEDQHRWIAEAEYNPNRIPLFCRVNNRLVGVCEIEFLGWKYVSHRAQISLSIIKEFWGQGIGSKMIQTMEAIARTRPHVRQLELDFFECNDRARDLYEHYGFRIVNMFPDAMILNDGTTLNEYRMVRKL